MRRLAILGLLLCAPLAYAEKVTCGDGTFGEAGRGACSHHGGVGHERVHCKDGTTSAASGSGACSHHGGVGEPETASPRAQPERAPSPPNATGAPRTPAPTPEGGPIPDPVARPTAKCKDGTMSYSAHHSGTCSRHGGVAQFFTP